MYWNHALLEQFDETDLARALEMYRLDSLSSRFHIVSTISPSAFKWNLRTYQPFRDSFPADAREFDRDVRSEANVQGMASGPLQMPRKRAR